VQKTILGRSAMRVAAVAVLLLMGFSGCLFSARRPVAVRTSKPSPAAEAPAVAPSAKPETATSLEALRVRVRVMTGMQEVRVAAAQPLTFVDARGRHAAPAGEYVVRLTQAIPAKRAYRLFTKSFKPSDRDAQDAYVKQWRAAGYNPEPETLGRRFEGSDGKVYDARIIWISLARLDTETEAESLKKRLEPQGVWGWIRLQTIAPGTGKLLLQGAGAPPMVFAPLTIESAGPVQVTGVSGMTRTCGGNLELAVNGSGQMDVIETPQVDEYLRGVVPSEMPAGWPAEALKAQTVAARSEILANIGMKHCLEGFDYCADEHCRAYKGIAARHAATDAAVSATANEVIVQSGRLIPAVFHANSGGWTENNEVVWSAPPDPALRARPDFSPGKAPAQTPTEMGIERWLRLTTPALATDAPDFRWTRRVGVLELSESVNKKYPVGRIKQIVLGDRGPGGRLRSVTVVGTRGSAVIDRDPAIRLAFGGLPSAMFMAEPVQGPGGPSAFVFTGGGRGHGVGLSQCGARARALEGALYREIVAHYFSGSTVERIR